MIKNLISKATFIITTRFVKEPESMKNKILYLSFFSVFFDHASSPSGVCAPLFASESAAKRAAATDARQLSEDEARGLLVPTIWAHQAGGVTSAHWDEFDSIIVQAAGTRLVSLWPPDLSDALNPLGELPTEQLVAVHDEATGGATGPAEEPDDITFPTAYTTRRCASRAECQVLTLNASETASVAWRVEHFSPLDLSDARAPAATLRCALGPGDALFLPRRWWHRMDDDPTDAHTDVMQVSFSWWFHAWWYNASA